MIKSNTYCYFIIQKLLSILLCINIWGLSFAQSLIDIQGQVLDMNDNIGLPYAHIFLENTSLGTSTDIEGRFHLEVPLNYNQVDSLVISFVGYDTQKIALKLIKDKHNLTVYLKPYTEELEGVTIQENYTVIDLLQEALDKRKDNYYEESPIYLKGYFYENTYSKQEAKEVRKLEAYLTTYRPQINSHKLPKVVVEKARKKMDKEYAIFTIGHTGILGSLDRDNLCKALKSKSLKSKDNQYQMQGLRSIDDRVNYWITLENHHRGIQSFFEIYIDTATLAFSKITEQHIATHENAFVGRRSSRFERLYKVPRYQAVTNYEYDARKQKWYLKTHDAHNVFIQKNKSQDTLHIYYSYVVQAIERNDIRMLPPSQCLSFDISCLGNHIQSFAKKWNHQAWKEEEE